MKKLTRFGLTLSLMSDEFRLATSKKLFTNTFLNGHWQQVRFFTFYSLLTTYYFLQFQIMRIKLLALFILSISLFTACQNIVSQDVSNPEAKRYKLKGKIISVDVVNKKVEVEHEDVVGYMSAMTMKFPVKNADWAFQELTKDAIIEATLVVDNAKGDYWLEEIGISVAKNPNLPDTGTNQNFAQAGKEVPNFTLTNQDGKRFSFNDYKGKALAITFIYSRCPLPEYCVKMSANFSDAAKLVEESVIKDKARFLSVSFDPKTDTPVKLKEYGNGYLGKDSKRDFSVWQLAVGTDKEVREMADFFGLRYETDENDKTQINHSLRTAIVAPDGKIVEIIAGNDWTAEDLVRKMNAVVTK
jgi:protein SCO1